MNESTRQAIRQALAAAHSPARQLQLSKQKVGLIDYQFRVIRAAKVVTSPKRSRWLREQSLPLLDYCDFHQIPLADLARIVAHEIPNIHWRTDLSKPVTCHNFVAPSSKRW